MKRKILILLLLSVTLPFISCKKFLEGQSQTDVVPKSASTLNEMIMGNPSPVFDPGLYHMDDDVVHANFVGTHAKNEIDNSYSWQPATAFVLPFGGSKQWLHLYPRIMVSNLVLDYVPKVRGTIAEKENVSGQAYLERAFNYFRLVNYYAKPYTDKLSNPTQDPGVPLILNSALSFEGKARNTVAEVYTQISADLDKGIELMERNGVNNSVYRINHIAGYLISSRVQLHLGNWEKVIEAATNVLSRKSDLMDLKTWGAADQNNKPIVGHLNQEAIWAYGNPQDVAVQAFLTSQFELSDALLLSYETGDLRQSIYIKNKISIKRPFKGTARTAHILRVSEALLNRAEAHAQLNKLGQTQHAKLALNDLNTLRKKRFKTDSYRDLVITDADDLLQECYDEKRREFFGEETHRWFDLRRHGMPSITHTYRESNTLTLTYVLEDHDPSYVIQIPQEVLEKNPKLTRNADPSPRIGH